MNLFLKILPAHVILLLGLPLSTFPQSQPNEHNKTVQPNNTPFVFLTLPGVDNFAVMSHSRPEAALKKLRSHVRKQKEDERREEEEEREMEDEERRRSFEERRARMEERRERRLLRHQQRLLRNHQEHQQRLLDRNAAVQQRIQARLQNNVNRQRTNLGLEAQNTDDGTGGAVVDNPNNDNSNTNYYQYDGKVKDASFHVYKPPPKKIDTYAYFPVGKKDQFSPAPEKKAYEEVKKDPEYYNHQSPKYNYDNGEKNGRYARDKKSKIFNPYLNEKSKKEGIPYKAEAKVDDAYQDEDDLDDVHSKYKIQEESSKRSYQRYMPSSLRDHKNDQMVVMSSNRVPRYAFAYGVNDPETGDVKGQIETRVGDIVRGQYSLRDTDGAVRTVTYVADAKSGFNAVVQRTNGVSGPVMTSSSHMAPQARVLPKPQDNRHHHQRRGERGMLSSSTRQYPLSFKKVDREFSNNAPFRRHVHNHFPFKK